MPPLADASRLEEVAAVLGAVGTVSAVLVALWLQWLRVRLREPRLSLSLGRQSAGVELRQGVTGFVDRLGLCISAKDGRQTAHGVEVLLSAAWPVPAEPDWEYLILDHQPLQWTGSRDRAGRPVTQLSLAPGISREVSLAWIGRPLDLYETVGLPRPTDAAVENADRGTDDAAAITTAFGIFDVEPRRDSPPFFIEGNLLYKLRVDLTARDIDTVSYEFSVQIQPKWLGAVPSSHTARNQEPVEIAVIWSDLKRVATSKPFAPMKWKTTVGDPPPPPSELGNESDDWQPARY